MLYYIINVVLYIRVGCHIMITFYFFIEPSFYSQCYHRPCVIIKPGSQLYVISCRVTFIVFRLAMVIMQVSMYHSLTMFYKGIFRVGSSSTFGHDTTDEVAVNPSL